MPLKDASAQQLRDVPGNRGAEWAPRQFWHAPLPAAEALEAAGTPTAGTEIEVYANQGRWVAECPDCHSAQLACRTDRRFLCVECGNVAVGGRWRSVVWPDDVPGIEAALEERDGVNQNWLPGETVADLLAENLDNVPPPELARGSAGRRR